MMKKSIHKATFSTQFEFSWTKIKKKNSNTDSFKERSLIKTVMVHSCVFAIQCHENLLSMKSYKCGSLKNFILSGVKVLKWQRLH